MVVSLVAACSSPTAPTPTPPVITTPPSTPPPLSIVCPTDINVTTSNATERITFAAPAISGGTPPVEVSCTRQSGTLFGGGTTSVQCTARDGAGQSTACTFDVTVTVVAPRISRTRFLAFGDSLTSGEISFPAPSGFDRGLSVVPALSYPTRLLAMLRARYTAQPDIQVVNAGLPGEWAQDSVRRFQDVLASMQPEAVLLMHGNNDIGAPLANAAAAAVRAMDTLAREARGRGVRVFLATLPPPFPGRTHSLPAILITSYNDQLRTIARGEGAVLVDVYGGLSTDVPRYIGIDGLHPTEAGYLRIAELFIAAIRNDLELPVTPP